MVDFNNETTIGTPALDVMRIYLLEQKANTEEAWRWFRDKDFDGIEGGLNKVRSRLEVWYLIMYPMIERHYKDEKITKEELEKEIVKGNKEIIFKIIKKFNQLLDDMHITRLDNKPKYNKHSIEDENQALGVNG